MPTQIVKVYFFIFKDYWCTKPIIYNFFSDFEYNKISKGIYSTFEYLTFDIYYTLNLKKGDTKIDIIYMLYKIDFSSVQTRLNTNFHIEFSIVQEVWKFLSGWRGNL